MRRKLRKILVTGGAGFIGSEFVRQGARRGFRLVVIDSLTYAGDLKRIKEVSKDIRFHKIDICSKGKLEALFRREKFDGLVHFAAETHVDRSLRDNTPFIRTNILGTQNLIDLSLKYGLKSFVHISTDEVYGQSLKGFFKESDFLKPRNPYAVTKASGEMLVQAAIHTFDLPAIIIRPANNYGPWQYPEKLIPVVISKSLKDQRVPVYGKGHQIREWLHVEDCARGIFLVLEKGNAGGIYNIGSCFEKRNIETVKTILKILGKKADLIRFVPDRLGHDFRYSVDCTKINKLGWRPQVSFDDGIAGTIAWYKENSTWLESKLSSRRS
jgi:dTDP-glucose 4,6-dehydratase